MGQQQQGRNDRRPPPRDNRSGGDNRRESSSGESAVKICYVITERAGRNFWTKIGVAFTNRDGSINVKLDATPVSGEFQIRDYVPREERGEDEQR